MDIYLYSAENLLLQAGQTQAEHGYHIVEFYVDDIGRLAKEPTERRAQFYYSPSGGTLRDSDLNIVLYSARYDKFKGIGKAD